MKIKNPMLVVTDIDKSVEFYKKVFGFHVIMDFGANKTLTGGLALQTLDTWQEFIGTDNVSFGSNSSEVYFEEDDFDKFAEKLKTCEVEYVHPVKEHSWGQRVQIRYHMFCCFQYQELDPRRYHVYLYEGTLLEILQKV